MCAKCECKKEHKWQSDGWGGWFLVNSEGEIVAHLIGTGSPFVAFGDRKFVDMETAKTAVEKSFSQTPSDADMIKRIRDIINRAAHPSRFGPPSSSALFMAIRRIVETPQK